MVADRLAQLLRALDDLLRVPPCRRAYRRGETASTCGGWGYAPTVRRAATDWSPTRPAMSAASRSARSAWREAVTGEPARGRDDPAGAQPHRVAAAPGELAPDRDEPAPERVGGVADRAVRRHRTPRDPTVGVDVAGEHVRVGDQRVGHRDAEDARTGFEREPQVAVTAHVDAGDERGRREARRRGGRPPARAPSGAMLRRQSTSAGSSRNSSTGVCGMRTVRSSSSARTHARTASPARRNAIAVGRPACSSATPSVSGPTICTFTRGGADARGRPLRGTRRDPRASTALNAGAIGSVDALTIDAERAVARDRHFGQRARPLRDQTLARIELGKLRHRGKLRVHAQRERGRRVRVVVRQAADAGREPGCEGASVRAHQHEVRSI